MHEFINKTVEILVAFSGFTVSGGSTPEVYKGTLLDISDEFIKLKLLKSKNDKDIILIGSKYIITIKEI